MITFNSQLYRIVNYIDCSLEQKTDIFNLRNDPEMRKWAADPRELSLGEHLDFIEKLKGNNNKYYFAVYKDDVIIGSYNLHRVSGTTWERGIFSSPLVQGKGMTADWESLILSSLPRDTFKKIVAEVRINNPRSLRYHEKMGFIETGRDKDYVYYKKELD